MTKSSRSKHVVNVRAPAKGQVKIPSGFQPKAGSPKLSHKSILTPHIGLDLNT